MASPYRFFIACMPKDHRKYAKANAINNESEQKSRPGLAGAVFATVRQSRKVLN